MNTCDHEKISLLIKDNLSPEERQKLLEHIGECEECKKIYDDSLSTKNETENIENKNHSDIENENIKNEKNENENIKNNSFPETPIYTGDMKKLYNPPNKKLKEKNKVDKISKFNFLKNFTNSQRIISAVAVILFILIFSAGQNFIYENYRDSDIFGLYNTKPIIEPIQIDETSLSGINENTIASDGDFIMNYNFSIKVEDVNAAYEAINNISGENLSSSFSLDSYDSNAEIIRQVNMSELANDLEKIKELGIITNESSYKSRVTLEVVDLESDKESKMILRERLMSHFKNAESIKDLDILGERISSLDYGINSVSSKIYSVEAKTNSPIINFYIYSENVDDAIYEEEETDESLGKKLSDAFKESSDSAKRTISSLLLAAAQNFVQIIFIIVIVCIVLKIKKGGRGHEKK